MILIDKLLNDKVVGVNFFRQSGRKGSSRVDALKIVKKTQRLVEESSRADIA